MEVLWPEAHRNLTLFPPGAAAQYSLTFFLWVLEIDYIFLHIKFLLLSMMFLRFICFGVFLFYCWVVFLFRRRQWHPTPVLLLGKSHGRRSLVGCGPWGCEESDMTERLHFHFSLWCIEENGNPLQCSCLENPREGVAQSWTRLKWLSSSSIPFYGRVVCW